MADEDGFARFQRVISTFSKSYIDPALKSKREMGVILDRPTDSAFSSVFDGFIEIANALDALKLCETLIVIAPPRSRVIKHDEYIKFLVGAYIQEMYILEQRLSTYATRMSRLYKNPQINRNFKQLIEKSLKGIVSIRGEHVHAKRYSDDELDMLSTLTLISQFDSTYTEHVQDQYKLTKLEWGKKIKTNNSETRKIVNYYFDILYPIMTTNNQIALPRVGKSAKT